MEYESHGGRGLQPKLVANTVFVLTVLCASLCMAQMEFRWLFGPWRECQHRSCGPGGRQYREVWCLHIQSNHRVLDTYCEPDFKPAGGRECNKPCTESIILKPPMDEDETNYANHYPEYPDSDLDWRSFPEGKGQGNEFELPTSRMGHGSPSTPSSSDVEWVIDQWSSCRLAQGAKSCGRNSGIQVRNVTCERKDRQGKVSPTRCLMEETMPATNQSCELLCRQNCVVTAYSEWSGCDSTCQLSNQTRIRDVVVPPRHRGSHCPGLSEMRVCENCTRSYTYRFSDWLPCATFSGSYLSDVRTHYLIGYQTREITCLQNKGIMTAISLCSERLPNTALQKHRACVIAHDCQVSPWSAMRPHNTSCIESDGQINHGYMVRNRQVLQLPLGDGQPCPTKLIDYIKLNKEDATQLRPCKRAKWIMSSWSPCQTIPGYRHCATGIQTRVVICVEAGDDGVERPVDVVKCQQTKPLLTQSCTLECSWDCSVSLWSVWSDCQDLECDKANIRKRRADEKTGKRFRTREILTLPGPGGKACPHLSETRVCQAEPCYTWNVTFGPCEATTRGGCGDGTQLKKAVCLNRSGVKVRDRHCLESLHSEQNWANCYLPCPEDCVLSEWGQWNLCPDPCLVQAGVGSVRSRQRQILAYHGPGRNSRPCPFPSDLRQTQQCPVLYDCLTYQWEASSWGQCRLEMSSPRVYCGPGSQIRTVECYTSTGIRTADDKCEESAKPKSTQPCVVECPIDCHVTEWSQWSDCGVKCLPVQARQIYPTQVRHRFLLQYPQNGGLTCPSDLRDEQSCFGLPVCQSYYWRVTDWSDCVLPPVVPLCGHGLRARNITCYHADDQSTKVVSVIMCLEKLGSMPELTEVCHVPCETECQFSSWSPWTMCGPGCEKSRFRYRRLLEGSKNNSECRNTELHPRDQHEECFCDQLKSSVTGGWSDCIIQSHDGEDTRFASMSLTSINTRYRRANESGVSGIGPQVYCGIGKRYMVLSCQPGTKVAGAFLCTGEEHQQENCTVPCPVDCQTTLWSPWSECSSSCGAGLQQRERRVMVLPEHGGRKCPSMYGQNKETQSKVCSVECNYHIWRIEDWGQCIPSGARACGEGTHNRTVRCVSVSGEGSEMTVDETFCSYDDLPQAVKPCSLPCPGDCVMSEWSDWTLCRQPCSGKQIQSRTRHVLRSPGTGEASSVTCSIKREERPCERWKNCIEYSWELSDWTSCLVNGGESDCGVGHKERYAFCRNENNLVVEPYKCEQLFGPVSEPMVVSCEIPCDIDCLLSDWSDWSPCSKNCGLGYTKRSSSILQAPTGNGRQCPDKLEQTKQCFHHGCYKWYSSDWSHCIISKGACGSGIQERNISCLTDEGRPVNVSRCPIDPEILIMQTSRPCHVPCPGECKLTEWSSWSSCYISCEDFEQGYTAGVQSRSRAVLAFPTPGNPPCNETPWEERACDAQQCTWFTWVTGDWDMATLTRELFCVRSDGVRVTGGCDEALMPPHNLTCSNPVCISPAACVDVNVCSCSSEKGLIQHALNATAITCVKNTTGVVEKAASGKEMAKSPNVWMYAVIAAATLLVIAVTAVLYNMCELFRRGPRPRRKDDGSHEASMRTAHSVDVVNGTAPSTTPSLQGDNICNHVTEQNQVGSTVCAATAMLTTAGADPPSVITPSLPCSPDVTPDTDALTGTPESSLTTTTTLLTPTNTDSMPNQPSGARGCAARSDHVNCTAKLLHKHNRRFKSIHRLLPATIAKCFFGNDNSSMCMLDAQNMDTETGTIGKTENQCLSLIAANSLEEIETYGKEVYTNTAPSFPNHNCMLSTSVDQKLTNLDLFMHANLLDDITLTETLTNPGADDLDPERTLVSADTSTNDNFADTNMPTFPFLSRRTNSYGFVESPNTICRIHEGSSHGSLHLGDTAETLNHNFSPSIKGPSYTRHPNGLQGPIIFPSSSLLVSRQQEQQLDSKIIDRSERSVPPYEDSYCFAGNSNNSNFMHDALYPHSLNVGISDSELTLSSLNIHAPSAFFKSDASLTDGFAGESLQEYPTIQRRARSKTPSLSHAYYLPYVYSNHQDANDSESANRRKLLPPSGQPSSSYAPQQDGNRTTIFPLPAKSLATMPAATNHNVAKLYESSPLGLLHKPLGTSHPPVPATQLQASDNHTDKSNILTCLHDQASFECKDSCSVLSLCDSCDSHSGDVVEDLLVHGHLTAAALQAYNLSMETSV
ncbi:hypothetical protein BsWGS_25602 [Bradybaena similaris]